ncbi:hypothetical protein HYV89_00435 [Candidatus Woesearchaeota archaeon]|nr:hypothetical protein [Candidatus Woesearchaeota archaeon]
MLKKGALIFIFLILISAAFALNSDFNNDGKVDFDDFFLFADNYQKNVNKDNEKFDLDKNRKIDVEDFFIFAEDFDKGKLIGDFDNNGCVDEKDFEKADADIEELRKQYNAGKLSASTYANMLKKYDFDNDKLFWSEKDKEVLRSYFGEGCKLPEESKSIYSLGDEATKPTDFKLLRAYHFNYDKFRDKWDQKKDRLRVTADEVIKDDETFEFSDEEYEAIAREDGFVAQSLGSNTELFVFQAPDGAKEITVSYLFKSGHNVGYGAGLWPKLKDGFDTYAYKIGETRINFNGYGAGSGEVKVPVENGKAYLIAGSGTSTWPASQYYYYIDRIGVV